MRAAARAARRTPRSVRVALCAALCAVAAGCATVHPWQRERLARPCMELDPPTGPAAFDGHVRAIRTGGVTAGGAGGGGCGCN